MCCQDAQIQELKEQMLSLSSHNEQMQSTVSQQLSQIQQHKDQYSILKLKLGGFSAATPAHTENFFLYCFNGFTSSSAVLSYGFVVYTQFCG